MNRVKISSVTWANVKKTVSDKLFLKKTDKCIHLFSLKAYFKDHVKNVA